VVSKNRDAPRPDPPAFFTGDRFANAVELKSILLHGLESVARLLSSATAVPFSQRVIMAALAALFR
jgi:hypothetical protein